MEKQSQAIKNFKEMVLKAVADRLKRTLTAAERSRIEEDVAAKSNILSRTPNHPPYAAMIYEAIRELNEESGSSEESISSSIINKYLELPYHHSAFLKLNLHKLCDKKEILMTPENCYVLACDSEVTIPDQIIGAIEVRDQPEDKMIVLLEEENKKVEEGNPSRNEKRRRGRGRGRANKQKLEEALTSDLILGLTRNNTQEPELVSSKGRGRLRKLGSGTVQLRYGYA